LIWTCRESVRFSSALAVLTRLTDNRLRLDRGKQGNPRSVVIRLPRSTRTSK
jgi:hypothetical protein